MSEMCMGFQARPVYRATTPTHVFWFNDINPETTFKKILVTYVQNGVVLFEKKKEDFTFETAEEDGVTCYYGKVTLTQEETNKASTESGLPVEIQIRVLDNFGDADVSNKIRLSTVDVLNDEVLT